MGIQRERCLRVVPAATTAGLSARVALCYTALQMWDRASSATETLNNQFTRLPQLLLHQHLISLLPEACSWPLLALCIRVWPWQLTGEQDSRLEYWVVPYTKRLLSKDFPHSFPTRKTKNWNYHSALLSGEGGRRKMAKSLAQLSLFTGHFEANMGL